MTPHNPTPAELDLERRIETLRMELRFAATAFGRKRAMQMIDALLKQRTPEMLAYLRHKGAR